MEALQGGELSPVGTWCTQRCVPLTSTWEGSSAYMPRVLRAQWMLQLWQGIKGSPSPTLIQPLAPSSLDTPFE